MRKAAAAILKQRPPKTKKTTADVPPPDPSAGPKTLRECLRDPELRNPTPRLLGGLPDLDEALNGGLMPGGLYVIGGGTGLGKTTLATNLFRRLGLNGTRALLISLEVPRVQVTRNLLAASAHVPVTAIEQLKFQSEERVALTNASATLSDLPLSIDDSTSRLDAISLLIKAEAAQGGKVVILDQMSWVIAEGANVFEKAAAISRRLKATAKDCGIVLIMLCQVNREGCKKENGPELYDLRDSGTIEQDADGVMMIRKVESFLDGRPALQQIALLKHRHGPQGAHVTANFSWFQDQSRIESYTPQHTTGDHA